ncbi:hypothetical protein Tco_1077675 [Tanacetum coccineum]
MGELPLITASTFTTRSPNNTPLTNRASTSANPNLVISPAFVEANYEVLESLLRDRRCDNHDLSRFGNQSIERDRLIEIGFVLDFVEFISFTFGDKEMIFVI